MAQASAPRQISAGLPLAAGTSPSPQAGDPASPDAGAEGRRPLSRRGLERLDLMLLCLECLDFNGGEALLWLSSQLGYDKRFPNRVELWKCRSHNPMRRACRRGEIGVADAEALMHILCAMADRLYPMLHTLLSSSDPPDLNRQRWSLFESRLEDLVRERMNPRRSAVQTLLDPREGAQERRQLVQSLAFVAGDGGLERLRASLQDAAA